MLNSLQCTRVSHTANDCLTQSAGSPLVEKQCEYKLSEGKDCVLFFTVLPTPPEHYPWCREWKDEQDMGTTLACQPALTGMGTEDPEMEAKSEERHPFPNHYGASDSQGGRTSSSTHNRKPIHSFKGLNST